MSRWRLFTLLLLCLGAQPAQAAPVVATRYEFYDVAPLNRHELRNELMNKSPVQTKGGDFLAYTEWKLHLNYQTSLRKNGCFLSSATVTLLVTYTLPRLDDNYFYDWATQSAFNRFYNALWTHEQGHAESGELAAEAVQTALKHLHAHPACEALREEIDGRFQNILDDFHARDIDYDKRTGHGRSQGVDINALL